MGNTPTAPRARLAHINLAFLGGVHHYRDGGGTRIGLDLGDRFEPVHARHGVIHEDHVHHVLLEELQAFFAGFCKFHAQAMLFQHDLHRHAGGAGVVDDERALECHGTISSGAARRSGR